MSKVQVLQIDGNEIRTLVASLSGTRQAMLEVATSLPFQGELADLLTPETPAASVVRRHFGKHFRQGDPVHVILDSLHHRSRLVVLARVPAPAAPQIVQSSFLDFRQSFCTGGWTSGCSTLIGREETDGALRIDLLQSLMRADHLEQLDELLAGCGLALGGVYSPQIVHQELFSRLAETWKGPFPEIAVHFGHSTTSLYRLEGGRIGAYRCLPTGQRDFLLDLRRAMPSRSPDECGKIASLCLGRSEPGDADKILTDERERSKVIEILESRRARYVRGIVAGLRSLTRAAPGASIDQPPDDAVLPATILLFGENTTEWDLSSRVGELTRTPCLEIDPSSLVQIGKKWTWPAPPRRFTEVIAALSWLARGERESANLACDRIARQGETSAALDSPRLLDARTALTAGVISVLVLAGQAAYGGQQDRLNSRLELELEGLRGRIPSAAEGKAILMEFRRARIQEVLALTRAEYLASLLEHRADWPALLERLQRHLPEEKLALCRLEVTAVWPGSGHGAGIPGTKSYRFTLSGESEELDIVTKFVQGLTRNPFYVRPVLADSQLVSEDPEGQNTLKSYTFTVRGEFDFRHANP